jgi:hypothetical protein
MGVVAGFSLRYSTYGLLRSLIPRGAGLRLPLNPMFYGMNPPDDYANCHLKASASAGRNLFLQSYTQENQKLRYMHQSAGL